MIGPDNYIDAAAVQAERSGAKRLILPITRNLPVLTAIQRRGEMESPRRERTTLDFQGNSCVGCSAKRNNTQSENNHARRADAVDDAPVFMIVRWRQRAVVEVHRQLRGDRV